MHAAMHPVITPPLAPTLAALGDDPRWTLDRLHEMGLRYVQLSAAQPGMRPRELDRSARRDLLATMRRHELEPAGIDLWIPPEHFSDPAHIDRATATMIGAIEMAADLGRVPMSVVLPQQRGEESNPGRGDTEDAIATIIAAAHRHGVPLADHAVYPENSAGREHDEFFGIGIDPPAWLSAGLDPERVIHVNLSSIISARLSDLSTTGMRAPIGSGGRLNVEGYKIALSVAGYQRPVVLDARQWNDPWTGVERSRAAWE